MTEYKYPWMKRDAERKAAKLVQARKGIPKKTAKLSAAERIHAVLKKDFLADHPLCQCGLPGCTKLAVDIHHKKGRGVWLNVVEFFLAVCRSCHNRLGDKDAEARKLGFTVSRHAK